MKNCDENKCQPLENKIIWKFVLREPQTIPKAKSKKKMLS